MPLRLDGSAVGEQQSELPAVCAVARTLTPASTDFIHQTVAATVAQETYDTTAIKLCDGGAEAVSLTFGQSKKLFSVYHRDDDLATAVLSHNAKLKALNHGFNRRAPRAPGWLSDIGTFKLSGPDSTTGHTAAVCWNIDFGKDPIIQAEHLVLVRALTPDEQFHQTRRRRFTGRLVVATAVNLEEATAFRHFLNATVVQKNAPNPPVVIYGKSHLKHRTTPVQH